MSKSSPSNGKSKLSATKLGRILSLLHYHPYPLPISALDVRILEICSFKYYVILSICRADGGFLPRDMRNRPLRDSYLTARMSSNEDLDDSGSTGPLPEQDEH